MSDRQNNREFAFDPPSSDIGQASLFALRAKLPERDRRIVERLDALEAVYVASGRDKLLRDTFDTFLRKFLTAKQGRRKHAGVFFLTGPSGAGKTEAVERMLREHPVLQPEQTSYGLVRRYVSISLKGYVTPRIVAENIMTAAGHRLGKTGRGEAWDQMPDVLMRRGVSVVHIDETQHIVKDKGNQSDNEELANAIKGASISPTWPIAFVLSGLPRILQLPIEDEQFERRYRWVEFPDLNMGSQRKLVVRILETMAKAVEMDIGNMAETDMPERIAHASRYRYARVCEAVNGAIHEALDNDPDATELTRDHFAMDWTNQTRATGVKLYNPYIVDDWASLPAGSYLGQPGDEEA